MTPSVWLVVLAWNGRADTMDLLSGLRAEPAQILLVDNGSTDGTIDAVRDAYPEVQTLRLDANLGFAGGNNAGISLALSKGAEIIGVLNNDTIVEPGFLAPLVHVLDGSEAGSGRDRAVSPDIRYADAPEVSWWRGSTLDLGSGWPRHLTPEEQSDERRTLTPTPLLSGCCIVARAETWRRVGYFDERLFLIFEDSDWSMRATSAGVDLFVVPESRIRHRVSRSFTGRTHVLGSYYFARNGLIFAQRHLGWRPTLAFLRDQILRRSAREMLRRRQFGPAAMRLLGVWAAALGGRGPAGRFATWVAGRLATSHPSS